MEQSVSARRRLHPRAGGLVVAACVLLFCAVGFVGTTRYLRGYWLYRGFPPPRDPAYVHVQGTTQKITVASPALGGRAQEVYVYLPPGYDTSGARRYPVLYLLHGFPGRPLAFLETVQAGVVDDELVAKGVAQPLILVMPFGSTGTFTDKEWADGVGHGEGWATFVARDLVHAIDTRYRTIASGTARAIGGLSEGGYGAINIALHHPGEFAVVESWSGYERATRMKSIFGPRLQGVAANSPLEELPYAGAATRRAGTYFWFYSGTKDDFLGQNEAFARELARYGIPHRFFVAAGGHNWRLWRDYAQPALVAAARRLTHA